MNERINRVSTAGLVILSAVPLLTVVTAAVAILLSGRLPAPEPDEGTGAHIFQLSIAALVPVGVVFLATADWAVPSRVLRRSSRASTMYLASRSTATAHRRCKRSAWRPTR